MLGSNVDSWVLDFHNQGQISLLCQPLSQILKRYLFWDSIQHYSISFNNLEIVICLVLVIYVFPWWKLRPHFHVEFFLLFHHCATMKTTSQITNLSSNFSSCYNQSSYFLPTHETMQSLMVVKLQTSTSVKVHKSRHQKKST